MILLASAPATAGADGAFVSTVAFSNFGPNGTTEFCHSNADLCP